MADLINLPLCYRCFSRSNFRLSRVIALQWQLLYRILQWLILRFGKKETHRERSQIEQSNEDKWQDVVHGALYNKKWQVFS